MHIHAVGRCEGPAFATAGGHFNPTAAQHGLSNPLGPHAGDLPVLFVTADGSGTVATVTPLVSLADGVLNSLFDADGSALVIHAANDDHMTDPTGGSGDRIACGVIGRPAAAAAVASPTTMPAGGTAGLTPPRTGSGGQPLEEGRTVLVLLAAIAAVCVFGGRALTARVPRSRGAA